MASAGPVTLALEAFDAAVFDLDGVVTRTASLHAATWKKLFDAYLRDRAVRTSEPFEPFDIERDYLQYVDGKPRYEGIRSFLEARKIDLPFGSPDDPPGHHTVCGLGNRKNKLFNELLARDGVDVYESSVQLIRNLRKEKIKIGLVSSSKNTQAVLDAAGLADLFDACVDGIEAANLALKGKPHPDTFIHAVELLGVVPARAFGVEDALSGVAAIRSAGYGLVIGVDRGDQSAALHEHGADIVVQDLSELRLEIAHAEVNLPNALQSLDEITQRLEDHRPAVFLDYDGTLTPIVAKPDLAVLSPSMRATIKELAALCTVAIISGRDRPVVEQFVGLDGLIYAGSHGFDIAGPDGLRKEHENAAELLPALGRAEAQLRDALVGIPGASIERKRFSIAVHYRLVAPEDLDTVRQAVNAALSDAGPSLRKAGGKKVFGIRTNLPWDKGRAVWWLLQTLGLDKPEVLPFYIGDDETDEDAFTALNQHGGIGIVVVSAQQHTTAHYALSDTDEVEVFLGKLVDWLKTAEK